MLEIKITVEIPGLPDAINNLADALRSANPITVPATNTVNGKTSVITSVPSAPASTPATEKAAAPATPATSEAPAPATVKSYTLDELSKAGVKLVDTGRMDELCAILAKYGVQAITQLDPSMYSALAAELKALGADL